MHPSDLAKEVGTVFDTGRTSKKIFDIDPRGYMVPAGRRLALKSLVTN